MLSRGLGWGSAVCIPAGYAQSLFLIGRAVSWAASVHSAVF